MKFQFVNKSPKKSKIKSIFSIESLFQGAGPDMGLLLAVVGLVIFGWVMVYSSSALHAESHYHDQFYFLKKQVMWSILGLGAFFVTANVPLEFFQKKVFLFYGGTIVLLTAVLIFGREIAGAKRWLHLGPLNFQPSELAKVCSVLLVADHMDRRQSRLRDFKRGLLPLLVKASLLMGLILVEPDLGTPFLMGLVFLSLLVLGGAKWMHLITLGLATLPVLILAIVKVKYRLARLLAYLNPWSDAQGAGYQLVQSLLALGSGGFIGRGLGGSRIKVSNLPDAHTDFIFAVLGEELGLIGTLLCASLFLFLCTRGLKIAMRANTLFGRLVGAGVSLTIGFQAVINMGVACGLLPTKGMPLPFISFGGSSLFITLISVGLLANISRQSKLARQKE